MTVPSDSPLDLLEAARRLLTDRGSSTGLWPRAAAILCRQALEGSLAELWRSQASGLEEASFKTQLLCLPSFLGNSTALAGRVNHVWWSLTRVCHYHPYELSPTLDELSDWLNTVAEFNNEVRAIIAHRAASHQVNAVTLKEPA
jgi:hypothetical protein